MGGQDVQEQMGVLKELQSLDQELNRIRQGREELDAEQAALGADVEKIRSMLESLTAEIEALEDQRRELNQALEQEKDNVQKAEGRLPSIKTQKEYVAVLKEIDTAKKLNKDLQEQMQEKEREIEALNRDREEKGAELEALQENVGARQVEIDGQLAGFEKTLSEKGSTRDSLLDQLPTPIRKRYQLLLERRGGVAVVEARNGACLGCNMHLPPQLFNSLFLNQEIQSCPHCNRLLYVEEQV